MVKKLNKLIIILTMIISVTLLSSLPYNPAADVNADINAVINGENHENAETVPQNEPSDKPGAEADLPAGQINEPDNKQNDADTDENSANQTYGDNFINEYVIIYYYYGTYNGCAALLITAVDKIYLDVIIIENIGGVEFVFGSTNTILTWKDGHMYSLKDAYDKGFLTVSDLQSINYYRKHKLQAGKLDPETEYNIKKSYYEELCWHKP